MAINYPKLKYIDPRFPTSVDGKYVYTENGKDLYAFDVIRIGGIYHITGFKNLTDQPIKSVVLPVFPTRLNDLPDLSNSVIFKSEFAKFSYKEQLYKNYAEGYIVLHDGLFKDVSRLDVIVPEDTSIKLHPQTFKQNAHINFIAPGNKTLLSTTTIVGFYDKEELEDFLVGEQLSSYIGHLKENYLLLGDNVNIDARSLSEIVICNPIDLSNIGNHKLNPCNVTFTVNKDLKIENNNIVLTNQEELEDLPF